LRCLKQLLPHLRPFLESRGHCLFELGFFARELGNKGGDLSSGRNEEATAVGQEE
jgi:hypothetical protein